MKLFFYASDSEPKKRNEDGSSVKIRVHVPHFKPLKKSNLGYDAYQKTVRNCTCS